MGGPMKVKVKAMKAKASGTNKHGNPKATPPPYEKPGPEKKCERCGVTKKTSEFPKHWLTADRLSRICSMCKGTLMKEKRRDKILLAASVKAPPKAAKVAKATKAAKGTRRKSDGTRECNKCHETKAIKDFVKWNSGQYGRICRECKRANDRDRYHRRQGRAEDPRATVIRKMVNGDHKRELARELIRRLHDECGVFRFELNRETGRVRMGMDAEDTIPLDDN